MINLKKVQKKFNNNCILEDINLSVNEGELIYIHGINGCGKSTLFKIICDILDIDSGIITIDEDTHVGALIENPAFLERDTIKYNLKYLADFNDNYNEKKIRELCQLFHLDFDSRTKMKNYSLGMRQKVGIIQAVMENQNLILLDEPTRGLDEESVESFYKLVNDLIAENKSVIIASHDKYEKLDFTKSYQLKKGRLIYDENEK